MNDILNAASKGFNDLNNILSYNGNNNNSINDTFGLDWKYFVFSAVGLVLLVNIGRLIYTNSNRYVEQVYHQNLYKDLATLDVEMEDAVE